MTVRTVQPGIAAGRVAAPPSKSYTHRALVAGHLTGRPYRVVRPLVSDDTRATREGLEVLGSRIRIGAGSWDLTPSRGRRPARASIECGESGTSLRLLVGLAARGESPVVFRGRGRLGDRPMNELLAALRTLGASATRDDPQRGLPLTVRGPIHGGRIRLDASRSSQFASSLLLTLPTLAEDSELLLTGRIVSEPYLAATEEVLRRHGVRVARKGRRFEIPGGQRYRGRRMEVPGDASSAAYLWAAAAVSGGDVRVTGIPRGWPQADARILDILEDAGARVRRGRDGARVEGRVHRPIHVDLTDAPDLYPLAAAVAACVPRLSRLRGAEHVVHKESDRRAGAASLARAVGATVRPRADGLDILGASRVRGARLHGLEDHRLVMSAAVVALAGDRPSFVDDARAVRKSFPGFWTALDALREGPV